MGAKIVPSGWRRHHFTCWWPGTIRCQAISRYSDYSEVVDYLLKGQLSITDSEYIFADQMIFSKMANGPSECWAGGGVPLRSCCLEDTRLGADITTFLWNLTNVIFQSDLKTLKCSCVMAGGLLAWYIVVKTFACLEIKDFHILLYT